MIMIIYISNLLRGQQNRMTVVSCHRMSTLVAPSGARFSKNL